MQMMETGEMLVTRMLSMENDMLQKMIIGYRDQMISMQVCTACVYVSDGGDGGRGEEEHGWVAHVHSNYSVAGAQSTKITIIIDF